MKTSCFFMIFYLTFFDIWDLSTSQNARNESKAHITATGVYVTAWEGQITVTASNSSSHESITHTAPLLRTPFTTMWSQNAPPPTSAACSKVHVGSFLGGMTLGFIITLAVCVGYRFICSGQQGHYRALEQHDAII
ncbi:porimin [Ictalurus punctatus]|uniref:Porimin n=1 Tax=Ictalurus punctatus TaxID=7998 RepID=A0A9F7R5N8_ICTPU|nr:porimin [Ictalurus punctatus]